ncbi:MAG TPA: DHA2 family efflux MFS transporter permease subunit [Allosphingosinicella sp.]|nr:DHA2 family efflux MFS transporter permease subunit [Allosphingosinicella sp.]
MATAASASPGLVIRPLAGLDRAMATVAIMVATVMQILDSTIANVALPHMQTSLGGTRESVSWVLTSYIFASAIAMPITGWLADRIGRKTLYLISVGGFTVASVLCATATSLSQMVAFRLVQGLAGAFLAPLGQATLLDIYPRESHAKAMTVFSIGVVVAPVLGPVLGGWLTENFNWRWVFLINLPIGLICIPLLLRFMPTGAKLRRKFDLFGFAMLAVALGALQLMLDRGEQLGWFDSWEIWIELGLAISGGWMFVVHLFTDEDPVFEPRMFADRNFSVALGFTLVNGVVVMATSALLPTMLQGVLGHTVLHSGLLAMPRGLGVMLAMVIAGRLSEKVDSRILIVVGALMTAYSLWMMAGFTLDMDSRPIVISGLIQGTGMGMIWMPVTMLGFATLEPGLRTAASSLLTLGRNLGGSVGISMVTSLLAHNIQVSHSDLAAEITPASTPPLDPSIFSLLGAQGQTIVAMLDAEINRQAAMIAYIDDYHLLMLMNLAILPFILLLRKPKIAADDLPVVIE